MAWVSPTGDTANGWTDSGLAWDDNTATFAYHSTPAGWGPYLELHHAELQCTKIQGWWGIVNTQVTTVEVDVYYSGAYHNIYSGAIVLGSFQEYEIGSEQTVTALRIRFYSSKAARQAEVYEVDFWEVESGVTHYGAATLSGVGTLAGLAVLILTGQASLTGSGLLSGAAVRLFTGKAVLAGSASLSAIGQKILTGAGSFVGTGLLSAAGIIGGVFRLGKATLSGVGSLTTSGAGLFVGATTLAGTGTLSGIGTVTGGQNVLISQVRSISGLIQARIFGRVN